MRTITTAVIAGSLAIASAECRSADPPLVHDTTYGFSMAVPAFPKQVESGTSVTAVSFGGPIRDGAAPSCNVQIQNMNATLSDFRAQSVVQAKALGIAVESEKPRKVSGKDALLFVSSGAGMKVLSLAVQVAQSIYLVTCVTTTDQFPKYEKAFHQAIDSFSLD